MTASSRTILRPSTLTLADQLAEAKKTNPPERAYQEASRQVNCQLPIKKKPEDGPGLPRSADQHPVIHPWLSPPSFVSLLPSLLLPFFLPPAPLRSASGAYNLACRQTGLLHRQEQALAHKQKLERVLEEDENIPGSNLPNPSIRSRYKRPLTKAPTYLIRVVHICARVVIL